METNFTNSDIKTFNHTTILGQPIRFKTRNQKIQCPLLKQVYLKMPMTSKKLH